jgi:hypothetical protein
VAQLRKNLARFGPPAAILAIVAAFTVLMLASGDGDGGGGGPSASVANPHPAAGSFVPDDTELAECSDEACFEQAFGNLVYDEGPKRAFEVFDAKMAEPGIIQADCHRIAHRMGSAALLRYDEDVGKAFSKGSSSCWSGYYHGILEWAFQGVPGDALGTVANRLCTDVRDQGTFLLYQCVHGLGHGLMITTGYHLPSALGACGELEGEWDHQSCNGGVFMENIATASGSPIKTFGKPKWLDDDDLLYPCNDDTIVSEENKTPCYLMATSRVLEANGHDFDDAAQWCYKADPGWVETCFQSLGRDSSGSSIYDPELTVEKCRVAGRHFDQCLWGASRDFTLRHAGGEEAAVLCETAPEEFRAGCFDGIGTIIATLYQSSRKQTSVCFELSQRYGPACAYGAQRFR